MALIYRLAANTASGARPLIWPTRIEGRSRSSRTGLPEKPPTPNPRTLPRRKNNDQPLEEGLTATSIIEGRRRAPRERARSSGPGERSRAHPAESLAGAPVGAGPERSARDVLAGRQGLEPRKNCQPTANYANRPERRSEETSMNPGPPENPFSGGLSSTLEKVGEMLHPAVNATDTRASHWRESEIDRTPGSNPGVPTKPSLRGSPGSALRRTGGRLACWLDRPPDLSDPLRSREPDPLRRFAPRRLLPRDVLGKPVLANNPKNKERPMAHEVIQQYTTDPVLPAGTRPVHPGSRCWAFGVSACPQSERSRARAADRPEPESATDRS
jgi:hypothetical protein